MNREEINSILGLILIIVLFILVSYIVQSNITAIKDGIGNNFFGIIVYIDILIIVTVIAPLDATPLLPIASGLWGWFWAAIFSIIGWTLGAVIAFGLARKYGVPLVKKFVSLEKIAKFEKLIFKHNIFWGIVFLRMAIPVDVLSYVLGLLSNIDLKKYTLATFIGVAPFAFVFAYIGTLSLIYQIIAFVIAFFIFLIGFFIERRRALSSNKPKRDKRGGKELNKRG